MSFIIFDTEYTTWKGCQENGWHGNQKKEIVQISAIKISNKLEVLGEFNQLCQPIVNPIVSDYFTKLTHITNTQIQNEGIPFSEAFTKFKNFIGNDICFSHAWGKRSSCYADGKIIQENLKIHHISNKKNMIFKNIAPLFRKLYQKRHINIKKQSSGQIIELLNIKESYHKNLNPHNALFDVYSILSGLKHFQSDPIVKNFIKSLEHTMPVYVKGNKDRKTTISSNDVL